MTQCVALLRGINVGQARRIAMAELRTLIEELGFSEVRTLLNSGNVVFHAARPNAGKVAASIETAIESRFGFKVPVIVVAASELHSVVAENPLHQATADPSKLLVAFFTSSGVREKARSLLSGPWAPEVMSMGKKAAYLWCPNGILDSKLMRAFSCATGENATTRNWATVLKLQVMVATGENAA